ncbi:hypothetical protein AVEN_158803-1 [Araneus ventricosus]|uniref:Uncharacterized protein n=1 Tax=Araneus ventricosus TaxID=182803 RepID=A0A4Y2NPA4_ARAVE|nr:hypothetical protein AVEN_158803-1 [Araneus ventricosus]
MVDNGLSTRQYERILEHAENPNCKLYPSYHKVKEDKQGPSPMLSGCNPVMGSWCMCRRMTEEFVHSASVICRGGNACSTLSMANLVGVSVYDYRIAKLLD